MTMTLKKPNRPQPGRRNRPRSVTVESPRSAPVLTWEDVQRLVAQVKEGGPPVLVQADPTSFRAPGLQKIMTLLDCGVSAQGSAWVKLGEPHSQFRSTERTAIDLGLLPRPDGAWNPPVLQLFASGDRNGSPPLPAAPSR